MFYNLLICIFYDLVKLVDGPGLFIFVYLSFVGTCTPISIMYPHLLYKFNIMHFIPFTN